jgi:hypothetical protein
MKNRLVINTLLFNGCPTVLLLAELHNLTFNSGKLLTPAFEELIKTAVKTALMVYNLNPEKQADPEFQFERAKSALALPKMIADIIEMSSLIFAEIEIYGLELRDHYHSESLKEVGDILKQRLSKIKLIVIT